MASKIEILKNINLRARSIQLSSDRYLFSIGGNDPNIKTSIFDKLAKFSNMKVESIYEDFLVIALAIFAVDKRFARSKARDAWTREFHITIPVLNLNKWKPLSGKINKMLSFLSGDEWHITFKASDISIVHTARGNAVQGFDCVSLFSGGLDSFCGAIDLLEHGNMPVFVGNEEYPKLEDRQQELITMLKNKYQQSFDIKTFTSRVEAARINNTDFADIENTTRTRSLLFLAAATAFASLIGDNIPIFIPENGFIGLNMPLTPSRMGSCSTRTTHPWFLSELNIVLAAVGILNKITNPFKTLSKTKVVELVKNTDAFKNKFARTISCSHPANNRWAGGEYPQNCGYCYPCLIRKSSLAHITFPDSDYKYDINTQLSEILKGEKRSDLFAMLNAAATYKEKGDDYVRNNIKRTGLISDEEINAFVNLYSETMKDFMSVLSNPELKRWIGEE